MAEPPAKKARRTDSSTMWEISDARSGGAAAHRTSKDTDGVPKRETTPREDSRRSGDYRDGRRDDRRHRSRSREKPDRRRERSRSRERRGRGGKESRRDADRDARDVGGRERSASRERRHPRKDSASNSVPHRDRSRSRSRTRARSPARGPKSGRRDGGRDHRLRDDDRAPNGTVDSKRNLSKAAPVDDMDIDGDDEEAVLERQMQKMMGFSRFRSTHNTKVPGNNVYGVRKEKKTQYRQYMNRTGGFNRPLSPTR